MEHSSANAVPPSLTPPSAPPAFCQFARGRQDKRSIGDMIRRLRRIRANAAARSIQRHVRKQQMRHHEQQKLLRANEHYFENMRWRLQDEAARVIQRFGRRESRESRPRRTTELEVGGFGGFGGHVRR